jgi:death on curing protein
VTEPFFVTVEDVDDIHAESLRRFGGSDGLRDRGLLESAAATPQASFGGDYLHPTIFDMAAAYAFHLAENQPFVDGNKRAALGAALVFLMLNDIDVDDPEERLYEAMIEIARHSMNKKGLAELLRELSLMPPTAP